MTYTFSSSQKAAYDAVQKGKNIFITGSGGNGKSYLTRALTTPNTLVCAPTGIAAMNVKGTTCHRAFGLPMGLPEAKDFNIIGRKQRDVLSTVDRIIISEVGMLRVDLLELIDRKLKLARCNKKPFGGVQMIVEGDFFQLEPIVSRNEWELFYSKYTSPYCFSSKVWDFETYHLTEPQRHPKIEQYNLLNRMRSGDQLALAELLSSTGEYKLSEDLLHLCCYNDDAHKVNNHWYNKNTNQEAVFVAHLQGKISEKDVLVPQILKLKVGCKVLLCANDLGSQYVNGDSGTVISMDNQSIKVRLISGITVEVESFTWETYNYTKVSDKIVKEVVGSFTQYPITLGYAISIHKAQGVTLDHVAVHVGKGCFSAGQLYVAVSRVKDLDNLTFLRKEQVALDNLIVSEQVKDFYGL